MYSKSHLKVVVINCANIPKRDKLGNPNPYVNLRLQGKLQLIID